MENRDRVRKGLMSNIDVESLQSLDLEGWSALERVGRALQAKDASLQGALDAILVAAVDLIDGTDFAGLNLVVRDRFEPQAVLGEPPHALDLLQQRTDTGPCVDASREQAVMRIDDMRAERRWPEYAELAVSLDVHAMLCVPLRVDDRRLGSLSLYARNHHAFGNPGDHRERLANLFAVYSSLALADAQLMENLRIALRTRDIIGQAKGILIERYRITDEAAFARLAAASQRANRKLNVIAEDFVRTGELPA
jgi:GAF domain-containing protein